MNGWHVVTRKALTKRAFLEGSSPISASTDIFNRLFLGCWFLHWIQLVNLTNIQMWKLFVGVEYSPIHWNMPLIAFGLRKNRLESLNILIIRFLFEIFERSSVWFPDPDDSKILSMAYTCVGLNTAGITNSAFRSCIGSFSIYSVP